MIATPLWSDGGVFCLNPTVQKSSTMEMVLRLDARTKYLCLEIFS